jgi:trigger factor
MSMLVSQAAQQYRPEDRQRFAEYVQSDPMVAAQLRAPLYEDKVVDFLFDKAEVTEREVTKDELQAAIEAEDGATGGHVHGPDCDHDHSHDEKPAKKAAAKKPAAKKADAEAEAAPAAEAAETLAKKAPAKKAAAKADATPADAAPVDAEAEPAKKAAAKKAPVKKD